MADCVASHQLRIDGMIDLSSISCDVIHAIPLLPSPPNKSTVVLSHYQCDIITHVQEVTYIHVCDILHCTCTRVVACTTILYTCIMYRYLYTTTYCRLHWPVDVVNWTGSWWDSWWGSHTLSCTGLQTGSAGWQNRSTVTLSQGQEEWGEGDRAKGREG